MQLAVVVGEKRGWPFLGFLEGTKHTYWGQKGATFSSKSPREHWDLRKAAWQAGGTGRAAWRKGPLSHLEGRGRQAVSNTYLPSTYYVPGTVLSVNKKRRKPLFVEVYDPSAGGWQQFTHKEVNLARLGTLWKSNISRGSGQEAGPGSRRSDQTSRELSLSPQRARRGLGRERAGSAAANSVV